MNICFFTIHPVLPVIGGVERITTNLADYFASPEGGGHHCMLLSVKPHAADDLRLYSLPSRWKNSPTNRAFFARFLQDHKIDVVIWQNGGSHRFLFAPECRKQGVRAISVSHGQPDYYRHAGLSKMLGFDPTGKVNPLKRLKFQLKMKWKDGVYRRLFAYNTRWADAYVLLSERYVECFKSYFPEGHVPCPVYGIGNACKPAERVGDPGEKKKELLFVGRLSYAHKRPDYLLRIWARLEDRFPDWRLRLVGSGEDELALKALASRLGLKRVSFEGFQDPRPYYRDAAVFCMTSAHEGFPMVLGEAAGFGCIPVAFESFDAVRDLVVDNENVILVPAFDLDLYAQRLEELMCDEARRARLSRSALGMPEKFSEARVGARWSDVLNGTRSC